MPVSDALRRLLRVRELEEEQQRATLDAALQELHRLESAFAAARERERNARHQMGCDAVCDAVDRIAALVESASAARRAAALAPRITTAESEAARIREELMSKRTTRRQVETLIAETESQDALIDARRAQQLLDDAHGARRTQQQLYPARPSGKKLD